MQVILGSGLTMLGMWTKCFINQSFAWIYVGQTLSAIGQPFLNIAPAKLAAIWFGKDEVSYSYYFNFASES
jgi:hypothetical protein